MCRDNAGTARGTTFSDDRPAWLAATANQNGSNGFYRFIRFVNTHSTAQINRFWATNEGSRYDIDEIEWGRGNGVQVPEPGTLWLLFAGAALILIQRGRRPAFAHRR